MKVGIVGLPNVGKSTLFNAITNAGATSANYPFCTVEPNIGVVNVPDERLNFLKKLYEPKKFTPATIEFVDIAGLVRGASKGEGLGNKFLGNIREVDAAIHVVRCFKSDDIIHVDGKVNPERDVETINLELIFSDIEVLNRRVDKAKKMVKSDKKFITEVEFLEKLINFLESGNFAKNMEVESDEEKVFLNSYNLLTAKPLIFVGNVSEDEFKNGEVKSEYFEILKKIAERENTVVLPICAQFEEEISQMEEEEKIEFLSELGLKSTGLDRLVTVCYRLLDLISFLTAGKDEVRAWTIKHGTKAPQAAGKIHSDFERGFIKAEVLAFEDLMKYGSLNSAKERGLVRQEGKDYIIRDGDVVLFKFNV